MATRARKTDGSGLRGLTTRKKISPKSATSIVTARVPKSIANEPKLSQKLKTTKQKPQVACTGNVLMKLVKSGDTHEEGVLPPPLGNKNTNRNDIRAVRCPPSF